MIAYVFWHVPAAPSERSDYERALAAFHRALVAAGASGFIRSETHRLDSVAWLTGFPVYEDWYLVDDSAALDWLEAAAIGRSSCAAHDAIAARAGAGAGGLYKCLLEGAPSPAETTTEWLGKPAGATYAQLIADLRSEVPPGGWLWQRKMVLGPTPEFCLVRPGSAVPTASSPLYPRRRIFP
jgi:hypothetical protein